MNKWISIKERLPKENQKVIIYLEAEDEIEIAALEKIDVWGNNKVPYMWDGVGPIHWFGQEVTHWMELPNAPEGRN